MRQKPIRSYIVDFYCSRLKLVIEIDGSTHTDKQAEDEIRQKHLELLGLNVIRIQDIDVKTNLVGVMDYLIDWIKNQEIKNLKIG